MGFLAFLYMVLVLTTGVPALWNTSIAAGLCGVFAPLLALIAGGGITAAGREADYPIWAGWPIGVVLLSISIAWVYYVGWHIGIGGVQIPGWLECLIGFPIGLGFGRKER